MISDEFEDEEPKGKLVNAAKIAGIILAIALVGGAFLYFTNPSMFASLPFVGTQENGTQFNPLGFLNSSGNPEQAKELVFRQINISTDLNSKEYAFALTNSNLQIGGSIAVEEQEKEKISMQNNSFDLKNFSGTISQKNSKIVLSGKLGSISGNGIEINYLENKPLIIEADGILSSENFSLSDFDSNVSGKISMPGISLDFAQAKVFLKNFSGTIELFGENIKLNGLVEELKAETGIASVQVT